MNKMSGISSFLNTFGLVFGLLCGLFTEVSALGNDELLRAVEEGRTDEVKTLLRQSENPIEDLNYTSRADGLCAGLLIERAQKWNQVLDTSDLDFSGMKEILRARAPKWSDRMRPREQAVALARLEASNLEIRNYFQRKNNELLEAKKIEIQKHLQQEIETFRLLLQEREGWLEDFKTLPGYAGLLERGEGLNSEVIARVHRACKDDLLVGSQTEKRAIRAAVTRVLGKPVPKIKAKKRKPRAPGFIGKLDPEVFPAAVVDSLAAPAPKREDEKVELENPGSTKKVKEEINPVELQTEESADDWFDGEIPFAEDQLAAFRSCGSIGDMLDQDYPVEEFRLDEWNSPKKSHPENTGNPEPSEVELSPLGFTSWIHPGNFF